MRRVLRVQLRAPDPALARRGAIVLEDAMRTASLPGADGARFVLVRSLNLGTIRAGMAPASLALRIEQRYRELAATAVYGLSSQVNEAATAPAVWFNGETEVYAALAARIARGGEMPSEWFWRAACPWYRPEMARTEALRHALFAALEAEPGGAPAAAAFCAQLLEANALRETIFALEPLDGPALLARCGFESEPSPSWAEPAAAVPPRWEPVLRAALSEWQHADARSLWLTAVALIAERQGRVAPLGLLQQQAHRIARTSSHQAAVTAPLRSRLRNGAASVSERFPEVGGVSRHSGGNGKLSAPGLAVEPANGAAKPDPAFEAEPGAEPVPPRMALPLPETSWAPGAGKEEFSPCAGVFFLIPIFARLGLPARRDVDPAELLSFIASPDPAAAPDLIEWTRTVRRWLHRRLRLRLAWLVQRPGRIAATRTHIDVSFSLRDADLRIRRLGLDIDPGWTPWLGKVVRFHYV